MYFWVPWGTAWRWIPVPPGATNLQPIFWVLWWTAWWWWTPTRRRESNWLVFYVLCVLGWFCSGKNEVLLDYWWCYVLYCRIIYGWRFNLINCYEHLLGLNVGVFIYDSKMNTMNWHWKLLINVIRLWIILNVNEFGWRLMEICKEGRMVKGWGYGCWEKSLEMPRWYASPGGMWLATRSQCRGCNYSWPRENWGSGEFSVRIGSIWWNLGSLDYERVNWNYLNCG